MSCKHTEDVCQDCLEKVSTDDERVEKMKQTLAIIMDKRSAEINKILDRKEEEEEEEEEEEVSSCRPRWVTKKTSSEKANEILLAASSLVFAGYVAFWNAKFLLKTGEIAVVLAKSIFRNLVD